jgi:hypothetical protein
MPIKLRDQIAMAALSTLGGSLYPHGPITDIHVLAGQAYAIADAMLHARRTINQDVRSGGRWGAEGWESGPTPEGQSRAKDKNSGPDTP